MAEVGLSIAVADAHPLLIPRADYVTHINGGRGAVREVCDLLCWRRAVDEAKRQSIVSKTRRRVIILLSLVALVLIGVNLPIATIRRRKWSIRASQPIKAITVTPWSTAWKVR